jgi:hypothetical protein
VSAAEVRVLGIRHHGPGSARSVRAELAAFRPDAVLVEGPADADPLVAYVGEAGMAPPVALLAYADGEPQVASFWPFAVFSPEWQAIGWAVDHGVPVRFCDLPAAITLAARPADPADGPTRPGVAKPADGNGHDGTTGPVAGPDPADGADLPRPSGVDGEAPSGVDGEAPSDMDRGAPSGVDGGAPSGVDGEAPAGGDGDAPSDVDGVAAPVAVRRDPLALLAGAAGYDDPERWWEDVVESRGDGAGPFDAITEAMAELRDAAPPQDPAEQLREDRREAQMRTVLRATLKSGAQRVAVVCGAWHAPALTGPLPPAAADARLLTGLPKRKVQLTWVPWTHGRLAAASGYGAGVTSPGWYHHLFAAPDHPVTRWLTAVAGVLREENLPVSSAHVIEAVRLAETLATLRERPLAGLAEVTEATRAVLVDGDEVALDLVTRRLVVGEALGSVPESAPTVPLAADLRASARRLRLPLTATEKTYELDLRKPNDLDRSRLLHRLRLLGVGWGEPSRAAARNLGTFRESWSVRWRPELEIDLVEASGWGTTVPSAAAARVVARASTGTLVEVTGAVEAALIADLPAALPELLAALDARAALDTDVAHLMEALPPLVRAGRYGDVRATDTAALDRVADGLLERIRAGLPAALTGLDDDAAKDLRERVLGVHAALTLREQPAARDRWLDTLAGLADRDDVHGLLTGSLVRLLRDAGRLDGPAAGLRLERALSVGPSAAAKGAWVEGFLAGGGLLLVHDADLLAILDRWVRGLDAQAFVDVLPLLRRTFGSFAAPEKRSLGSRLRGRPAGPAVADDDHFDADLAAAVLPTVELLLGRTP